MSKKHYDRKPTDISSATWVHGFPRVPITFYGSVSRTKVDGVGINDSAHNASYRDGDGVQHFDPCYRAWHGMIRRCYSEDDRNTSYAGCTVCDEWLQFSNFQKWFDENYVEGYQLDKDLTVYGSKVYSPETCAYIPKLLNSFLTDRRADRGGEMLGVCMDESGCRYMARVSSIAGRINLGYHETELEAHQAWLFGKGLVAKSLQALYPEFAHLLNNAIVELPNEVLERFKTKKWYDKAISKANTIIDRGIK